MAQFAREPPRIHRSLTVAIALCDKTIGSVRRVEELSNASGRNVHVIATGNF